MMELGPSGNPGASCLCFLAQSFTPYNNLGPTKGRYQNGSLSPLKGQYGWTTHIHLQSYLRENVFFCLPLEWRGLNCSQNVETSLIGSESCNNKENNHNLTILTFVFFCRLTLGSSNKLLSWMGSIWLQRPYCLTESLSSGVAIHALSSIRYIFEAPIVDIIMNGTIKVQWDRRTNYCSTMKFAKSYKTSNCLFLCWAVCFYSYVATRTNIVVFCVILLIFVATEV